MTININLAGNIVAVDIGIPDLEAKIDALAAKVDLLLQKENQMVADLKTLEDDVAAETTVNQSAITLLNGLSAQLKAAANDPARVQAIATNLEANSAALAAAVAANTATAPASTPAP